jgi:exopolyphosphatase/guanosine-5'-triphosphate,3'-diphosphate pyrophosphatase
MIFRVRKPPRPGSWNVNADGSAGAGSLPTRRRHGWLQRGARRQREGAAPPGAVRPGRDRLYGALDLGTNNCRLLVARPSESGFEVVDAFSRIVRLGEGTSASGRLNDEAMARTINALRVCANKLRWWNVSRVRLVATEACRMAANGQDFIARVGEETGLRLEIIDREMEARLAVAGAAPLIEPRASQVLVFDIGGGSTEVMWLKTDAAGYRIDTWTSLPAGVVTIAERFGGVAVSGEDFGAMRAHVRPMLQGFAERVAERNGGRSAPDHLLGTSGTVTTVCGVQLGLRRYDRSRVDGCWLRNEEIGAVTDRLLAMTYEERSQSPCIGRERADLVLAGCAILEEIRNIWPVERLRVADRGLREGLLTLMMMEDGTYGQAA